MWSYLAVVAVLIILLVVFTDQAVAFADTIRGLWKKDVERMEEQPKTLPKTIANELYDRGYEGEVPWTDVIKTSLDPSTFTNHEEFVKDVRRFSSGANFTSVTDDNTNIDFVNFRGLRRPEHVPIGATARQVPDIDETVLMRNKPFRW